jgi:hypothetical protein
MITMAQDFSMDELNAFIVQAKAATYVGSGVGSLSRRPGSHDLEFHAGDFAYLDSYYGGADFLGQEVVYYKNEAVWVMNYYGRILEPEKITAAEAGQVIKASLTQMYAEGRFLGGFTCETHGSVYRDTNDGDMASFTGREWIEHGGESVYELVYHGGLVKY